MSKRPRRDTVDAECRGGPRDGERWAAYMYGSPMFPDARLHGYVFDRTRLILEWNPDSPNAMRKANDE